MEFIFLVYFLRGVEANRVTVPAPSMEVCELAAAAYNARLHGMLRFEDEPYGVFAMGDGSLVRKSDLEWRCVVEPKTEKA